jgi:acetyl esterase/lipase
MTKYLLLLFVTTLLWSCTSDGEADTKPVAAIQSFNVSYGSDPEQTYDVYLPDGRSAATKVIFLVHGGGWIGGSKEDMNYLVEFMKIRFPQYAIVNLNYRLATQHSPAYPKQIDDIALAVAHVGSNYKLSKNYGLIGASAGGHLSMLYSYKTDTTHQVKFVCNVVGPTDFHDPSYDESMLEETYMPYIGTEITDAFLTEISPISYVSTQSAPTIQFMGNADPLIPTTQGERLKARLDSFGVPNQLNVYDAQHGDFSVTQTQDINAKLSVFLAAHF